MTCASIVLAVHLATWHASPGFNNVNPGVQVQCDQWVAGTYYNSLRRQSAYGGYTWPNWWGPIDLSAVLVTGYPKAAVLPLVVPSFKLGAARLSFMPSPRHVLGAVHLSLEY